MSAKCHRSFVVVLERAGWATASFAIVANRPDCGIRLLRAGSVIGEHRSDGSDAAFRLPALPPAVRRPSLSETATLPEAAPRGEAAATIYA
jgi:hypothetical protein